jgi:hypothetical protein
MQRKRQRILRDSACQAPWLRAEGWDPRASENENHGRSRPCRWFLPFSTPKPKPKPISLRLAAQCSQPTYMLRAIYPPPPPATRVTGFVPPLSETSLDPMARFSKLCPGPKCSGQCRTPCYRSLSFFELHAPAGIDACAFGATACASVATACAPGATSGARSLLLCSLVCLLSIFVFSAVASAKSTFATVAAAAARPNGALTVVSTRQLAPAVIDGRIDASVGDLAGL